MAISKCLLSALFVSIISSTTAQVVEVPGGKIQGEIKDYYVKFEGIPYALAPVGKHRYEPPQPFTTKWEGIRNATAIQNICIQWDQFYGTDDHLHGDEDCLYINVYTPAIDGNETFDVIVYIHGGAFMFGSGSDNRPDRLLKYKKIVLVTLNYRLGPLGFLCTEDNEISCNIGLKDQNMALRWVRDNIHAFKGNPKKVIITGYSAGGASVHLHMLSPQSRGLFIAAVSHSGTAFCSWASVKNSLQRARKLASYLGCPAESTKLLKRCLKTKDAKDIVRAVKIFHRFMYNPFTVFGPTIEKYGARDAFITDKLDDIILRGRSARVPWVVAFTQDEGGYNAATLMQKDSNGSEYINSLGEIWPQVASEVLFFNESVPTALHESVAERLKRHYLGDKEFSVATYRETQKMYSDQLFIKGIDKSIRLHMKFSNAPVYTYRYNKTFTGGIARLMSHNANINFGSIHGDDVYHIFVAVYADSNKFDEKDDQISQNFAQLYSTLLQTAKYNGQFYLNFTNDNFLNRPPIFGNISLPISHKYGKKIRLLQINDADDYKVVEVDKLYD